MTNDQVIKIKKLLQDVHDNESTSLTKAEIEELQACFAFGEYERQVIDFRDFLVASMPEPLAVTYDREEEMAYVNALNDFYDKKWVIIFDKKAVTINNDINVFERMHQFIDDYIQFDM